MNLKLSEPAKSILLVGLAAFLANHALHAIVYLLHGEAPFFLCRNDCGWYSSITESGYMLEPSAHDKRDAANWAFFPLFPLLGFLVERLTGLAPYVSLILLSKLLLLPAIWAFLAFQRCYAPATPLWIGAVLVALNPASIYAHTGYTETLFLMLTSSALLAIRQDKPILAGLLGGLSTGTRLVGLGVGLVFLAHAIRRVLSDKSANGGKLVFAGLLIPMGLAVYMLYLHLQVGDALAFSHIQRAWGRQVGNPLTVLSQALADPGYARHMAIFAIFALIMSIYLAAKREFGLAIFLAFATLIPLSTGIPSMARYVLMQPAMLLALGMVLTRHRWLLPVLAVLVFGYVSMLDAWLEGRYFVI